MTDNKETKDKEKPKKFMLPSSLRNLQQTKKSQSKIVIIEHSISLNNQTASHHNNTHIKNRKSITSSAIVSEVPVDTLRKRSKSNRLESLKNEVNKEAFSLLDHYKQPQDKQMREKKNTQKKYNIDLRQMNIADDRPEPERMEGEDTLEKYQIVKPSETYLLKDQQPQSIFQPTIFQTPILPCFSSEFQPRGASESILNKKINEGEGVWRVGKIKVKGNTCTLKVGQFQFQGAAVRGEGKAGALSANQLYWLPNWKQMWILQPQQSLFLSD